MTSLKATLAFGTPANASARTAVSVTGTLVGYVRDHSTPARAWIELDDTIDAAALPGHELASVDTKHTLSQSRTTVLPRRKRDADGSAHPSNEERPRFDVVRLLGEGGVGTVELARDNDIRRTVAVKKVRSEVRGTGALLRFADEVRIVGQLEHPNIVPIYDVGRDDGGDVYLVMKHLQGETMEEIIEKLRAGDEAYLRRFSAEFRAHLYLSVLDAVRYAHARGVLHRDLKPANVMIGPFNEVTVMDWGIAKPIGVRDPASASTETPMSWLDSQDQRLLETQVGALAGTPLYMSPEQAGGLNDTLDARSDVYTLSMMFYEWLTLEHPLAGKSSLMEVLGSIVTKDFDADQLMRVACEKDVPVEYVYLLFRGLERDRNRRLSSVDEMYDGLKRIVEGNIQAQCPVTLTKRVTHEALHWIDRHPRLYSSLFFLASAGVVLGLIGLAWKLIRALT